MQRVDPHQSWPLHNVQASRVLETALANTLPAHTLMQGAGLATARLALALWPHARHIWLACGPGNNGGDGLEAAMHLQQWGKTATVSWLGKPESTPADARASYARAVGAGVPFVSTPPPVCDLVIDALLGIGASRPAEGQLAEWIGHGVKLGVPVLAVDLPSGLNADTGATLGPCMRAHHTLSLLTLKPGLFTAQGRDHAGEVWLDTLGAPLDTASHMALLNNAPSAAVRAHNTHKGSYGELAVIGGASGMVGAALLAAIAALHHGAGRVYIGLLDNGTRVDVVHPELMFRAPEALDVAAMTVVAGCGGGHAMAGHLPRLLSTSPRLVLDADALNAIAADSALATLLQRRAARRFQTVLTPHPLEAARLLQSSTALVQQDRLSAAQKLAQNFGCTVVLKGSGTVIADPAHTSRINPTGNARLASAGTGDVLAGLIGARLAQGESAFEAAKSAVWLHGQAADAWPPDVPLSASALAQAIG